MATDDIKVGLKVTLDEESMAKSVQEAEAKLGKKGGAGGGIGGDLATVLHSQLVRPVIEQLKRIEQRLEKSGASTDSAAGLAKMFIVVKVMQELYNAVKAVLRSMWNLAESLARFSPTLMASFRNLQILLRMLSIDLGRLIGKELASIVDFIRNLIAFFYVALRPMIKLLFVIIAALVSILGKLFEAYKALVVWSWRLMADITEAVGKLMEWLGSYIPGALGTVFTAMGVGAGVLAESMRKQAKAIEESGKAGQNAAQQMNAALIKGFSDMGKEKYTGVAAPGQGDEQHAKQFIAPLKLDSHGKARTYQQTSNSVATGRKPVSMQTPQLASVVNNVQLKAEVKMQHEEAVQRAIEEIRSQLVKAIHSVRNEQLLLANRVYARSVVDL